MSSGSTVSRTFLCWILSSWPAESFGRWLLQATGVLGASKPSGQSVGSPWNTLPAFEDLLEPLLSFAGCFLPTRPGAGGSWGLALPLTAFSPCCPWWARLSPGLGDTPVPGLLDLSRPALSSQLQAACPCIYV